MDLSHWFLKRRWIRTGLMVVALAIGVAFAFEAGTPPLRIAGAVTGILMALLTKLLTEVYLLARKDAINSAQPIDVQARTELIALDRRIRELAELIDNQPRSQLIELDRRLGELTVLAERFTEHTEPARRHVLHNGPGPRELRLRDMMDSLSTLDRTPGPTGADQELGSNDPVAGGSINSNG